MAYLCTDPDSYTGKKVGNGECVTFVQQAAGAPVTATWKQGAAVRGNLSLAKGTAIATFDTNGKYANLKTGNHAAIYVSQDTLGLFVYDQWRSQGKVLKRHIRFNGGKGSASNDGDAFSVID